MPYSYEEQLIDAAAMRRQRLGMGLLFRADRARRQWRSGVRTLWHSAFLATLLCAGCVAVSFVTHLLATDPALSRPRPAASAPTAATASAASARSAGPERGSATGSGADRGADPGREPGTDPAGMRR